MYIAVTAVHLLAETLGFASTVRLYGKEKGSFIHGVKFYDIKLFIYVTKKYLVCYKKLG